MTRSYPPVTRTYSAQHLREEYRRAGLAAGEPPEGDVGLTLHGGLRYSENIRRWVHTCPSCGYQVGEFMLSPWTCRNRFPHPDPGGDPIPCNTTVSEWDRPWVLTRRDAMPWDYPDPDPRRPPWQ